MSPGQTRIQERCLEQQFPHVGTRDASVREMLSPFWAALLQR